MLAPSGQSIIDRVGIDTDLAEQVDVAVAMAPEVEVLADHDGAGPQASHEHPVDERLGALGGLGLVERNHDDGVGAPNDLALPISQNTGLGTRTRHDLSVLTGGQETYNPNYVFATWADPEDVIWVGTWGGGASRYENGTWRNLTMKDGLAGNIVYAIAQDATGAYWFGTNRGVSRYDGTAFTTFDAATGLPGNDVYAIAVTPANDVWVGTRDGVVRLSPKQKAD